MYFRGQSEDQTVGTTIIDCVNKFPTGGSIVEAEDPIYLYMGKSFIHTLLNLAPKESAYGFTGDPL